MTAEIERNTLQGIWSVLTRTVVLGTLRTESGNEAEDVTGFTSVQVVNIVGRTFGIPSTRAEDLATTLIPLLPIISAQGGAQQGDAVEMTYDLIGFLKSQSANIKAVSARLLQEWGASPDTQQVATSVLAASLDAFGLDTAAATLDQFTVATIVNGMLGRTATHEERRLVFNVAANDGPGTATGETSAEGLVAFLQSMLDAILGRTAGSGDEGYSEEEDKIATPEEARRVSMVSIFSTTERSNSVSGVEYSQGAIATPKSAAAISAEPSGVIVSEPEAAAPASPAARAQIDPHVLTGFARNRPALLFDNAPIMKEPLVFDPVATEGHRRLYLAEIAVKQSQLGAAWDTAVSLFERAATQFAAEGNYLFAGHAYVRCSDCTRFLCDEDATSSYIVSAAECYGKAGDMRETITAFDVATEMYRSAGRANKVGRLTKIRADRHRDAGDYQGAIAAYVAAAGVYRDELEMRGDAQNCLSCAVDLAMDELADPGQTIELLEASYDIALPFQKPMLLAEALACRMVCVPPDYSIPFIHCMEDVENTFDRYTTESRELLASTEYLLCRDLIQATKETNPDALEEAVGRYLTTHTVPSWFKEVLHHLHQNTLTKRDSATKLFTINGAATLEVELAASS